MEQTQKKKTAKPYSPEFRERAVRLVMEHRDEYRREAARADGDCRQIGLFAGQPIRFGPGRSSAMAANGQARQVPRRHG